MGRYTKWLESTRNGRGTTTPVTPGGGATVGTSVATPPRLMPTALPVPKRFHGSVALDPTRVGRNAGRVADEVIA